MGSETCPKCPYCESLPRQEGLRFFNEFHCGTGYYGDEPEKMRQSYRCKDRQIASLTDALAERDKEIERLKAENEHLRKGAPLGPIIGAQTILEQEMELKKLRELVKIPSKEITYKAVMARSEQLKKEPVP